MDFSDDRHLIDRESQPNEEIYTAAFSIFDADKDGLISASDLSQALEKFGIKLTESEAKDIIRSNSRASDQYLR